MGTAFLVLLVRDHLKMIRVTAETIIAQMVDLFLGRYISKIVGENHYMDSYRGPIEGHAAIATGSSIAGGWPLPDMAGARKSIYLITQVDNGKAGCYLGEDVLSSFVEHLLEAPTHLGNQQKRCSSGHYSR